MADVSSLVRKVNDRSRYIAERTAIDIGRELRGSALRHDHNQTGKMIGSINVTLAHPSPSVYRITAEVPVIQAATTDRGARPHIIRPRNAKVLRFVSGGRVVFARVVDHPGNRGSGWFTKVFSPIGIRGILSRFVGR